MPMVPEPFLDSAGSFDWALGGGRPMAANYAIFCPNLDIPAYREPLSDEKKAELDDRTAKLRKRAALNRFHSSSEFCWEVFAWNDVFGRLYNDETFWM